MNNFKRLISALLCMAVMFTSVAVFADEVIADEAVTEDIAVIEEPAETAEEAAPIEIDWERIGLLEAIGVIDEVSEEDAQEFLSAQMSRAEFAVALIRFANMASVVGGSNQFKDVIRDSFEEPYINTAVKAGLIAPVSEGYFYPKYPISYQDAAQAFVMSLGYTPIANVNNSWIIEAKKLGLMDGINTGGTFTRAQAYRMIFNALHTDIMDIKSVVDDVADYEVSEGIDPLNKYFGIKHSEGIITGAGGVTLGTGVLSSAKEYIKHNNKLYKYVENELSRHLGRNAVVYRDENDNAIYVMPNRNEELTIPAKELSSYSSFTYKYGENDIQASIDNPPNVILNNTEYTGEYIEAVMKPTSGSITLVDNDRDGIYDIVFINSYKDYYVKALLSGSDKIIAAYAAGGSTSIDLNPDLYDVEIYSETGQQIDITGIAVGNVISLMESGTRKMLYVSTDTITGSVSKTSKTYAGGAIWTIDGADYTLSELLEAELAIPTTELSSVRIGETYTFSRNIYGEIVYYEKAQAASGDEKFYAILTAGKMEGLSNEVSLKVFAKEFGGWQSVTMPKKLQMNGTTLTAKAAFEALNRDGIDGYRAAAGRVYPQPIKMKVNENNEVTYIGQASVKEYYDSMDGYGYTSVTAGLANYSYTLPTITEPSSFPNYEPDFYLYMGDVTGGGQHFAYRDIITQAVRKGANATEAKHPYSMHTTGLSGGTTLYRALRADGKTRSYQVPYYMNITDVDGDGTIDVGKIAVEKDTFFAMASIPRAAGFRMMAYKEDPDSIYCSFCTVGVSADAASTVEDAFSIRLVTEITEEYTNDAKVIAVNTHAGKFFVEPSKINLDALDFYDIKNKKMNNPMTNEPTYQVKPGDLINVKLDTLGYAVAIEPVFDGGKDKGYFLGDYVKTGAGQLKNNKYYNGRNNPFTYGTRINGDNKNRIEWIMLTRVDNVSGAVEGRGYAFYNTARYVNPNGPGAPVPGDADKNVLDYVADIRDSNNGGVQNWYETNVLSMTPGSCVVVSRDRFGNITTRNAVGSDLVAESDAPGEASIILLSQEYGKLTGTSFVFPAEYWQEMNWVTSPAQLNQAEITKHASHN